MGSETVASDAFRLGLSSAWDGNQTGFKWDQITASSPQNVTGSSENAFQVFRVELTLIDRFTSLRWTSGERGETDVIRMGYYTCVSDDCLGV